MWRFVFAGTTGAWTEEEEKARDIWIYAFRKVTLALCSVSKHRLWALTVSSL